MSTCRIKTWKDLKRFTKIGFTINPQFSDETAACVVITEDIYAMILTHAKFKEFTKKEILRYIGFLKTKESVSTNIEKVIQNLLGKESFAGRD